MVIVYVALTLLTVHLLGLVPKGFVPEEDQGYLIVAVQAPRAATIQRTEAIVKQMTDILLETEGVSDVEGVSGYNLYGSVTMNGVPAPGSSSGEAVKAMEEVAREQLPENVLRVSSRIVARMIGDSTPDTAVTAESTEPTARSGNRGEPHPGTDPGA